MINNQPPIVCIIGKKKSGKTTTAVGLVKELVSRGHLVMTAKHGHGFEIDTEGTDSFRHRFEGGAHRVAMASPDQVAVVGKWGANGEMELPQLVQTYLSDAEIVIAEGFKSSPFPKIEVYRQAAHVLPLYDHDSTINGEYLAILTDKLGFQAAVPVLDINSPERFIQLADMIETRLLRAHQSP